MTNERATALLAVHKELDARLTDFAGWAMPLQYSGIVAEHNAVRTSAGVFDVSHLGKLRISGPGGGSALQHALTADVAGLEPGRATYSLVLTDAGGCVDDVFVYRLGADEWLVVPNAANVEAVGSAVKESGGEVVDDWDRWSILALQGPASFEVFAAVFSDAEPLELKLHTYCSMDFYGHDGLCARTGYTGEKGFELYIPVTVAPRAFKALIEAGAAPVGLGARDTLRLEMGYALYGNELTRETNPLEAGLGWAVAWETDFRGKEALEKVRAEGPARKLFGISCTGRGVPRHGYRVYSGEVVVGDVTSGNFSPTLGRGIALALGDTEAVPEVGKKVEIEARGRRIEGDIVKPPFVPRGRAG
ncbi:MAG: glycine cleavage system aminomethyltransferase GcvT [Actinomycetota bacterium]|nr:glycine cleavage system aminomethyltransferase GcvT [Actinomycetota bacterium]